MLNVVNAYTRASEFKGFSAVATYRSANWGNDFEDAEAEEFAREVI